MFSNIIQRTAPILSKYQPTFSTSASKLVLAEAQPAFRRGPRSEKLQGSFIRGAPAKRERNAQHIIRV